MVGTDSTATAVRCIFYYIVTNPRVYASLQRELDEAFANGALHRPILRDAEARKLPYLQACITEGLRIWPPVAALAYKKVPPEGETLEDGRFIPAGTNVGISTWALHRSKTMYGPDADLYRPERWLEARGEKLQAMNRDMELVFGGGRYTCLGKTIAFLELNKAIAEVNTLHMLKVTCASALTKSLLRCFFALITPSSSRRRGLIADAMECSSSRR
jgi:cytochrome P450